MTNLQTLLPIQTKEDINTVNARDLHTYLKFFSNWIRDVINRYNFVENEDYLVIANSGKNPSGGRPTVDYYVTLDVAKEICMVSKTDKGREARKYFIECEKRLNAVQVSAKDTYLLSIMKANDELSRAVAINNYELGYVKPLEVKAEYHDTVLNSDTLITTTEIAKDYGITARALNKILLDSGVQYKPSNTKPYMLYKEYAEQGLAQTVTTPITQGDKVFTTSMLKWTQKGRKFIHDLLKEQGIVPIVEH